MIIDLDTINRFFNYYEMDLVSTTNFLKNYKTCVMPKRLIDFSLDKNLIQFGDLEIGAMVFNVTFIPLNGGESMSKKLFVPSIKEGIISNVSDLNPHYCIYHPKTGEYLEEFSDPIDEEKYDKIINALWE